MEVELGIKINAVICILKNEQNLLLLKRNKPPNEGLFTPVGGKLDPYENPEATAYRETFEETGIKVKDFVYGGSLIETSPTKYNWNSLIYVADIDFTQPPPCSEGTLHWIPIHKMDGLPTPPTDSFIYAYVLKGEKFFLNAEYDENLKLIWLKEELRQIKLIS